MIYFTDTWLSKLILDIIWAFASAFLQTRHGLREADIDQKPSGDMREGKEAEGFSTSQIKAAQAIEGLRLSSLFGENHK